MTHPLPARELVAKAIGQFVAPEMLEGVITRVLTALGLSDGSRGWQPIKTAPKDGTVVDLWYEPFNGTCRRLADMWAIKGVQVTILWRNGDNSIVITGDRITHWRYPPAPPAMIRAQETK